MLNGWKLNEPDGSAQLNWTAYGKVSGAVTWSEVQDA